jgi:hypothetical protein
VDQALRSPWIPSQLIQTTPLLMARITDPTGIVGPDLIDDISALGADHGQ